MVIEPERFVLFVGSNIFNSPAYNTWALNLTYSLNSGASSNAAIVFLANGDIDMNQTTSGDYGNANAVFQPFMTATNMDAQTFWKAINWIYVSLFWTSLYDLGQVSTTIYWTNTIFLLNATALPTTNNIFVNSSLFDEYSSFLETEIVPRLNYTLEFSPVTNKNRAEPVNTTFVRSYSCLQRTQKDPIAIAVSILVADYSLIVGAYGLILAVAVYIQLHQRESGLAQCVLIIVNS
jgi:hypothetical protein